MELERREPPFDGPMGQDNFGFGVRGDHLFGEEDAGPV